MWHVSSFIISIFKSNYSELLLGINWELGNWAYTSRQ
jgi:hypothetical protein